ncbi:MAG: hypothetical protein V1888_04165 [archaeon]
MKTVWTFTNKRELDKNQFIDYVERKVFRTIRKHQMLPQYFAIRGTPSGAPKDKIITLKKSENLNTKVLKQILETKFQVQFSNKPNISSDNLSEIAEQIFKQILKGNFNFQNGRSPQLPAKRTTNYQLPTTRAPLLYLSDKEIELYASLKNIKGTRRKQNKTIQTLFNKFFKKNQDLELNILKAQGQLK